MTAINVRQLDELIRVYRLRSTRKNGTRYQCTLAAETAEMLERLKACAIPLEGSIG